MSLTNMLAINLDELINSVESVRREFKATWSEPIRDQITRSICAFANDFFNLNGGYIVVGIEEQGGLPVLPPRGLEGQDLDSIQKQIRGQCKRIDPEYQPVISPEIYQGKSILVLWAPAGDVRPYQAPKTSKGGDRAYYIRQGSETVEAQGEILTQLMQMTAKVPFDDRRSFSQTLDVLAPSLVRNFLSDIRSGLVAPGMQVSDQELYRQLRISVRVNGYDVPKNVALLFFTHDPEQFFPGVRIEIAQFGDDAGGDLIEEKVFRGPLHTQINQALDYLNAFSAAMVRKIPNQAEAQRTVAFPYEAMEEALVNAVYHRSYDGNPEPVKIYLYPDRMELISYPGPVPGIELQHFEPGATVPPVPNRNRRIGEFLKDLRLAEGRGTGIPKIYRKMTENGSPRPIFEFDAGRTYFRVILPAHPQYVVIQALRESAHLWAVGERTAALRILEAALDRVPSSGALVAQIIDHSISLNDLPTAERVFAEFDGAPAAADAHLPYLAMARYYLSQKDRAKAAELLAHVPSPARIDDLVELAVLYKRSGKLEEAHSVFSTNYDLIKNNPKAVHEYAQSKLGLANQKALRTMAPREWAATKKRLFQDAVELLRRAIQLADDNPRKAWCYYDLAMALDELHAPDTEVAQAFGKAIELLPYEEKFPESYQAWRQRRAT
ncbi:MAG: putative DNA binding domain-containing protein [Anaerolinea sp.]|nr:putative DNA binding domain-containing protein [Anaerolinea sp.]